MTTEIKPNPVADAMLGLCTLTRHCSQDDVPGLVEKFLGEYPVIARSNDLAKAMDALTKSLGVMCRALKGECSMYELERAITHLENVEAEISGEAVTK